MINNPFYLIISIPFLNIILLLASNYHNFVEHICARYKKMSSCHQYCLSIFVPHFCFKGDLLVACYIRELKHATFLSTRTVTGSDFAKKLTSHVTDVKSQTSKLPIWRLW